MAQDELKAQISAFVDEVWEDVVKDIDRLVRINSVEDLSSAAPGQPWGKGPHDALVEACKIASELGLDAHDCDGYIGYADLAGESEKQLAMIAHTDIVPVGEGWDFDPLAVTRKDGYLVGRGVIDDKGPLVLALYAAHYFARQGKLLPYTLRCIIGTNEETSMGDVEWYLEHHPQPAFLFTPDADFPLCYGEKGGWSAIVTSAAIDGGQIVELDGGTVGNAIPGKATALVKADLSKLAPTERIAVEDAGEGLVRLVATGIGGHASKPQGTINAIALIVNYLLENGIGSAEERTFLELDQTLLATTDGSALGIATQDSYFDPLTIIGGTVRTVDGHFVQTLDSRYPTSITGEKITAAIERVATPAGASVECDLDMVPFVTDPTSAPIQTLIATYNEMCGKNAEPFTMGGGTYARHFERAASFGPNEPDAELPNWAHGEHSPNEAVSEELLKNSLRIYILALSRLMEQEL